jgi:hypothetical protein
VSNALSMIIGRELVFLALHQGFFVAAYSSSRRLFTSNLRKAVEIASQL